MSTISQKKVRDEVDFLHADKHQSLLQVDFNTLGIKVSYKVIISLLMGLAKYSQITQSNKFVISWQYLKKEVMYEVHFLHTDEHQSFYKLALLLLIKVAIFAISSEKKYWWSLFFAWT